MGKLTWHRRAAAVLFPERCVCCGEVIPPPQDICAGCNSVIPRVGEPVCPYCGCEKPFCTCQKHRRLYKRVVAPFYYDGAAKTGMLSMKQSGNPLHAAFFSENMAERVRQYYDEIAFDAVVYVPSFPKVEKRRGFNPGYMVAKGMANALELPIWHALLKLADNPPQKGLPAEERSGNVLGVFEVAEGVSVRGKTLLLADDIVTTGATMEECAKMLKIHGAREVYAVAGCISRKEKNDEKAKE